MEVFLKVREGERGRGGEGGRHAADHRFPDGRGRLSSLNLPRAAEDHTTTRTGAARHCAGETFRRRSCLPADVQVRRDSFHPKKTLV